WLLGKEPPRQGLARATALNDPSRVAAIAVQLQTFLAWRGVGEQPHVRHRFWSAQRGLDAQGPRRLAIEDQVAPCTAERDGLRRKRRHRLAGIRVEDADVFPAAVAVLI